MGTYRNLIAWQKSMDLVDRIYETARGFPKYELFGLAAQLRSAAASVPSNIAKAFGRYTIPDQRQFLRAARGSIYEVQTQIEIARRQHFIDQQTASELTARADEVGRLVNGLLRSLLTAKG